MNLSTDNILLAMCDYKAREFVTSTLLEYF